MELAPLILALLNILIVAFAIRALYQPTPFDALAPGIGGFVKLTERICTALQPAIPLPMRGLCGVVIVLLLLFRGALLYRMGAAVAVFEPSTGYLLSFTPGNSVPYWLLINLLQFLQFWLQIITAYTIILFWSQSFHFNTNAGFSLTLLARPFSQLKRGYLACLVVAAHVLLVASAYALSTNRENDFATLFTAIQANYLPDTLASSSEALHPICEFLFMTFRSIIAPFEAFSSWIFFLILFSLFGNIFRRAGTNDTLTPNLMRILLGPIPPIRLGVFDISYLLGFFAISLISSASTILVFVGLKGLSHVLVYFL